MTQELDRGALRLSSPPPVSVGHRELFLLPLFYWSPLSPLHSARGGREKSEGGRKKVPPSLPPSFSSLPPSFSLSLRPPFLSSSFLRPFLFTYLPLLFSFPLYISILFISLGQPRTCESMHKAIQRGDVEMVQTILQARSSNDS